MKLPLLPTLLLACGLVTAAAAAPRNVILVLADDHRHDFMGFMPQAPEWLETPAMDRMAAEGVHLANAFVSTSLCSPSRASILTGRYMHHHRVVDNQRPVPDGTRYFTQDLQAAGWTTGLIGKWHMGHDSDEPQPGFNYWASFRGQGDYTDQEFNINGERKVLPGYNTDVCTDLAIDFLRANRDKPFYLHLAFKSVHFPFDPAPRHRGRYQGRKIPYPETMARTEENYRTQSRWVKERRFGIHGIDHMETGAFDKDPVPDFDELYWRYCENVVSVDENLGRLLAALEETGLAKDTLVLYLGDNGFALGEHGFYDKRDAFETSMRIPLLAWAPGHLPAGSRVDQMVQNIDIAPSLLDLLGVKRAPDAPAMDGLSFVPLLQGRETPWRAHVLYEYHWEWNFPAQPTTFAIRTERFKYIYYHGVWDRNGLYDLQTDPHERHNLIDVPAFQETAKELSAKLFAELETSGALNIPVMPPKGETFDDRKVE